MPYGRTPGRELREVPPESALQARLGFLPDLPATQELFQGDEGEDAQDELREWHEETKDNCYLELSSYSQCAYCERTDERCPHEQRRNAVALLRFEQWSDHQSCFIWVPIRFWRCHPESVHFAQGRHVYTIHKVPRRSCIARCDLPRNSELQTAEGFLFWILGWLRSKF